ncbi:MAG: cytochrome P450, partial [Tepidiformaceae bacterium]
MPPSPRSPAFMRLPWARRNPVAFLRWLSDEAGDVSSFRYGRRRVVFLNDPAAIQEVLSRQPERFSKAFIRGATKRIMGDSIFVSDGPYHDRQRAAIQPKFRHDSIGPLVEGTFRATEAIVGEWPAEGTIDARFEMQRLALRVSLLN